MTNEYIQQQKDLQERGYAIIDDFLPIEKARQINNLYLNEKEENWSFMDQTRDGHYGHVFKTNNPLLPKEGEPYKAKFWRSENLESDKSLNEVFNNNFKEKIKNISAIDLKEFDNRCYRLKQGNYYRLHLDDYAGYINSIYYVNENWKWDWGGILHVCDHDDPEFIQPIFPRFNRLVLLNNQKFRSPHFISQVSEFAQNPRYSIVSFNK